MRPLFDISKISDYRSKDLLPFECEWCGKTFHRSKHRYLGALSKIAKKKSKNKKFKGGRLNFCGTACMGKSQITALQKECAQCSRAISVQLKEAKKSKSGNNFCSSSCAATFNNKNKKTGTRRSKLEVWMEDQIKIAFPDLEILFNDKKAIQSELDIYLPKLKLAFELNGIFHYKPIYGQKKFTAVKKNDREKKKSCKKEKIELIVVNVSKQTMFKEKTSMKFFNRIVKKINSKLNQIVNESIVSVSEKI